VQVLGAFVHSTAAWSGHVFSEDLPVGVRMSEGVNIDGAENRWRLWSLQGSQIEYLTRWAVQERAHKLAFAESLRRGFAH
jgi:hypothetical protein